MSLPELVRRRPPVTPGEAPPPPAPLPPRKIGWRVRLRRDRSLLLMVAPAVLLLAVFAYVPMLGNVIAWQSYSPYTGFLHSPFVGWANFERVFTNPAFVNAVENTLLITAFQLVFFFPIPILLALLLNSVVTPRLRTAIQSIVYLPHFFSWVLVVTLFQQIFGGAGLINQTLREHGLGNGFDMMTNPDTFLVLVTMQSVWKDAGWGIIIFLAALSTVPPEQYEAAAVDGASRWRRMWHISLPALRPVIVLLLILRLGDALTVGLRAAHPAAGRRRRRGLRGHRHLRLLPGRRLRGLELRRRGGAGQGGRQPRARAGCQQAGARVR